MNFLAHLLLAGDEPVARAGSLYPDLAQPRDRRKLDHLPELMQCAIAQHLAIDAFTDLHPIVARSKGYFRGPGAMGGRLSGVLVDVFYDHILARDWARFHPQPLPAFIAGVHGDLRAQAHLLPASMRYPMDRLLAEDWLSCYATVEGIAYVLTLMSGRFTQRLHRLVTMQDAVFDLVKHDTAITADFHAFFPLVKGACPLEIKPKWSSGQVVK